MYANIVPLIVERADMNLKEDSHIGCNCTRCLKQRKIMLKLSPERLNRRKTRR
jgi:hypothetical protein